jgi:hypothetical protein
MTDLTHPPHSAQGDGAHSTLETSGDRGIRPDPAEVRASCDEGGDPACWAHLFEDDGTDAPC